MKEVMEFSKIQEVMMKSNAANANQPSVVIGDVGELGLVPIPSGERVLFVDDRGVLREAFTDVSYVLPQSLPTIADDTEIPPHVLDHMYAKKPREPGTEPVATTAKPRRRTKRKDPAVEQFIIPDAHPPAPKINIIRQRRPIPVFRSILSKPKILQGRTMSKTQNHSGVSNLTSSSNSLKGKANQSKGSPHLSRSNKKEEHAKTMYASFEEANKVFSPRTLKDPASKPQKNNHTRIQANSSAIITMDDLQRVGAGYDEMLFDFGIAEDDEGITLGGEGFSDGEFDEFNVSSMEVFSPQNQKPPSKSPMMSSRNVGRSESSDEDDSNQMMVSMERRSSQDWVQFLDEAAKQVALTGQSNNPATNDHDTLISADSKSKSVTTNGADSKKSTSPKNGSTTKDLPTARRSNRVIRTPAWLIDSEKHSITKGNRKKNLA